MSDYEKFLERARKRRQKMERLRAKGMTFEAIAQKLGISRQRVSQIAKSFRTAT